MAITWITPKGSLGTIVERTVLSIPLEATSTIGAITFSLIAGNLPRGLRLEGAAIEGSPTEVKKFTESRFVIRASDGVDLEDRTFAISVDGSDVPQWITQEGFLNVGPGDAYFVLDNAYVDFQLEIRDPDVIAGDVIEYYQIPTGGELPPGLSISKSGRISGFTDPVFAVNFTDYATGSYDAQAYDILPLDKGEARSNGFDSYLYDNVTFDYTEASQAPKRLSRFYTFLIAASDGINEIRRLFRIYVVTEEFLKSDNSIMQVDTNLFQADSGSQRNPLWITSSNLGRYRANNYLTVYLDVYDPPSLEGVINYFVLPTNAGTYQLKSTGEIITNGHYEITGTLPEFKYVFKDLYDPSLSYSVGDAVVYVRNTWVCQKAVGPGELPVRGSEYWSRNLSTATATFRAERTTTWTSLVPETVSAIPPGMSMDPLTGEIAGRVPYQSAVSKNYQFTVQAINFPVNVSSSTYNLRGDWSSAAIYEVNDVVKYTNFLFICAKSHRNEIPANNEVYWTLGTSSADKTFTIEIVGEIESAIAWLTDPDLGTIKPNQPSQLFVEAESLLYGGRAIYEFVSGTLPPGLRLLSTGLIDGKVKQFADDNGPGLTRFFDQTDSLNPLEDSSTGSRIYTTTFDGDTTDFDKQFKFKIKARDSAEFAANIREFTVRIVSDTTKTFANLYLKAFQTKDKRLEWYNFITNANIFRSTELYRDGDPNFGIQTELKTLLFAGIESREAVNYVQAMSRNHYNKRLRFGDVKFAQAKDPTTQEPVYEVVYIEMVDEYEKNGKSISKTIQLSNTIESKVLISYDAIKVDSDIPLASDSDHQRVFPNSVKNMRARIRDVGERDREFLPLWMRSIQGESYVETGYVKAIVLCYTKPGNAALIISRIKANGFDFKSMDFEADRYLIDILDGQIENKYLAFPQRGEKLP